MLYFLLSTLVLTLYIDVVLSLSILLEWLLQSFAHGMVTVLSVDVQKFVVIMRPELQQNIISIGFEVKKTVSETGFRVAGAHLIFVHRWIKVKCSHDDIIKWKHFPRCWPCVREIHRSPVNSPHKGQWRGALGALKFSLIYAWKKHSRRWWFETPSCPYDVTVIITINAFICEVTVLSPFFRLSIQIPSWKYTSP